LHSWWFQKDNTATGVFGLHRVFAGCLTTERITHQVRCTLGTPFLMCTFVFNYNDGVCIGLFYLIISLIGFVFNSLVASVLQPGLFFWCNFFCGGGGDSPPWARASSFTRFLDHTQRHTTIRRTYLDEWSARRRDLYLTIHNTHNRQTSMPAVRFEPTISVGERPQAYTLDRAATETGV
jgi:hypothetical protein